ncbi:hypothetical protein QWY14_12100 [Planococcus sp. N028]|uniref:DUF3221 domain-containing protein n=1 Tax=Planococcus shixiaomingii TaxID=3058393 RepID=A0ABT8N3T5_9BACL|nr:hypothetical protein [Planococcus sp. N028]MDN7242548.1 hypothetical protein [Planococcus sp. N028]
MKKLLSLIVGSLLLLTACGNYEGTVTEKTDSSFMLEVTSGNSEAESSVQEMHLTDHTIFSGAISTFEELEVGDQVVVVPAKLSEDFPYILVSEAIVE